MSTPSIAYVIAAHNEELAIPTTVRALVERLDGVTGSEVIVVENGSTDQTAAITAELARDASTDSVRVIHETSEKGFGNALRRGMVVATADLVMLTAADLPFGFTDLDAALALDPRPEVVIGSKAHPDSKVEVTMQRRVMSQGFRMLRRAMFGLDVGDTQGTILVERDLGQHLLPELESGGYFLSTELIVLAARDGARVVEVPVDYSNPRTDSKVKPVRDSMAVLGEMRELRHRLRRNGHRST